MALVHVAEMSSFSFECHSFMLCHFCCTGNLLARSAWRGRIICISIRIVGTRGRGGAVGGVCGRSNDVVWRKNGFRMHKVYYYSVS